MQRASSRTACSHDGMLMTPQLKGTYAVGCEYHHKSLRMGTADSCLVTSRIGRSCRLGEKRHFMQDKMEGGGGLGVLVRGLGELHAIDFEQPQHRAVHRSSGRSTRRSDARVAGRLVLLVSALLDPLQTCNSFGKEANVQISDLGLE